MKFLVADDFGKSNGFVFSDKEKFSILQFQRAYLTQVGHITFLFLIWVGAQSYKNNWVFRDVNLAVPIGI